jgi:hypothetical protein
MSVLPGGILERDMSDTFNDMRNAPRDGTTILVVTWYEMTLSMESDPVVKDYYAEFHAVQWEEWDEPGWFDQDGNEFEGVPTGWISIPKPKCPYVEPLT